MPAKRYKVTLTGSEREELKALISKGKATARKLTRARILLKADESECRVCRLDSEIAEILDTSISTVERTRKNFVEEGIQAALNHKRPYRSKACILDGEKEAHLIAISCSTPPEGRERWTMQLLADRLVELNIVDSISDETVRLTLKKMNLNPG